MRSNIMMISVAAAALLLSACAYQEGPKTDHSEDNIVGNNLSSVSSVNSESGADQAKIAMYDPTVCRIHQFDMGTGTWERTLTPPVQHGAHKVMYDPNGNYVIDVTDASLTVLNKDGTTQDPLVSFVGAPKSASFRPQLGYVAMQDDSKTAVLMTIDSTGFLNGRRSLGQIVHDDVTMLAGDIDDQGNLILALSDGNIALYNIPQTIATGTWTLTYQFQSGLSDINWLAPLHDGSHQILVKTSGDHPAIAVFDTQNKVQVGSTYQVPSNRLVIKTSKLYDPHFIIREDTRSSSGTATIVYASAGALHTVPITNSIRNVLSSRISVTKNTWSMVDTSVWKIWDPFYKVMYNGRITFDDYNIVQQDRLLQRFSLNSMLPLSKYKIPDTTQLQIGESKIFQLYPSNAGWAVSTQISNPSLAQNITKFNIPFLHKETCH